MPPARALDCAMSGKDFDADLNHLRAKPTNGWRRLAAGEIVPDGSDFRAREPLPWQRREPCWRGNVAMLLVAGAVRARRVVMLRRSLADHCSWLDRAAIPLSRMQENSSAEATDERTDRQAALLAAANLAFQDLVEQEWLLRTQLHFAGHSALAVQAATQRIMGELRKMVSTGTGSFDALHEHLREFFEASRSAHREMLDSKA